MVHPASRPAPSGLPSPALPTPNTPRRRHQPRPARISTAPTPTPSLLIDVPRPSHQRPHSRPTNQPIYQSTQVPTTLGTFINLRFAPVSFPHRRPEIFSPKRLITRIHKPAAALPNQPPNYQFSPTFSTASQHNGRRLCVVVIRKEEHNVSDISDYRGRQASQELRETTAAAKAFSLKLRSSSRVIFSNSYKAAPPASKSPWTQILAAGPKILSASFSYLSRIFPVLALRHQRRRTRKTLCRK